MNRKPLGSSMLLSRALLGFLNHKEAEGLTTRSVDHYRQNLAKWLEYEGDKEVGKVTPQNIINYLTWLRTEYTPIRFSGKTHPLSNKTLRNHWIVLSSFFNQAHLELCIPEPMEDVLALKYKVAPVEAFTKEEIEKLLKACAYSREAKTEMRKKFAMKRVTANRDQALILFLSGQQP